MIVSLIFFAFAGMAEAVMDTLQFKFYTSVFRKYNGYFWNPDFSWQNKWKQGDPKFGPKFFGSSTFLVWTTDAWHLFKWIRNRMIDFAVYFLIADISYALIWVIGFALVRSFFFEEWFKGLSK